jgi:hypothetical protein
MRMTHLQRLIPLSIALATVSACEYTKTENPLSPLIAGPMANVELTTPVLLEPQVGWKFKPNQQPLTLLIENPSSNSPRPFYLLVEVASDVNFANKVYVKDQVPPGTTNGRTSVRLPEPLAAGRTYYWRVKANDGANASEFTPAVAFDILAPIVIGAPTPLSPAGGGRIPMRRPALTAGNAVATGPHATLFYLFEVSLDPAFSSRVVLEETIQGQGQTVLTVPDELATDKVHYWRARVSDGEVTGQWSRTESFRTPLPVVAPPPPGGPPSGPPQPGGTCASSDGVAIVQCIEATYPSYLAAGVSSNQREANMEFLRDRIIEAGICGGLDLAWNLKRGTGPRSIDALAWRTNNGDEVVDIGAAFDDTSQTLRLQWGIVGGPPGYDYYTPRPICTSPFRP